MFGRDASQLSSLFNQESIHDGESLETLAKWGKIESLENALSTSFKFGRNEEPQKQDKRISVFGDNKPIVKRAKTLWEMILQAFEDQILIVLCIASVVSLVLGIASQGIQKGWLEGASILLAVVIIVTVTSGNNYVKEQQFRKLNEVASRKNVNVLRQGQQLNISAYDMLVGDVQMIQTGEILSVDGILLQGNNVVADESAMTGQSLAIKKRVPVTYQKGQANPFLISGSKILEGTGSMLVLATGPNSQFGILKSRLQSQAEATPLQQKLAILAQQIGKVGLFSAIATFFCMVLHILHDAYSTGDMMGSLLSIHTLHHLVEAFIIAVSIIVVAVPEGLPLAVTIALAYSVGKMKDQNNLVRYLQACETMGGADNICSDKTGTLTKNIMSVTRLFMKEQIYSQFEQNTLGDLGKIFSIGICQNSNATPQITKQPDGKLFINQIGNKTECALLELAYKLGYPYRQFRDKEKMLKVFPFSSKIKSMSTIADVDGTVYTFTKGAPDFVLPSCTHYLDAHGNKQELTPQFKEMLMQNLEEFASQTLRTILLCFKQGGTAEDSQETAVSNLTIFGMVGIKDPIREQIPHAVQKCFQGGVRVRMITGDNSSTAVAIAKQAGILEKQWAAKENDCTVMTGKDFREYVGGLINEGQEDQTVGNMQNFKKVATQLKVLARSSPSDKYLMATGLKRLHHVVAMTGDGTNDAPALKRADIGFAMGITGTQVAKDAAGIILLDDNFNSIVTAMKWGRNIFDSIRKFLQFQLTVNFVALILAFTGAAVLKESPLNPIQMLWVNLIMDTLAALALATQPPTDQLLKRKPYSRFESLITADMFKNVFAQGLLQIIILGTILFRGPQIFGIQSSTGVQEWNDETGKHYSIFFHVFVLLQLFNEINARKLKSNELNVFENFFNNPLFIVILLLTILIQVLCIEFGGQSIKTVPLTLHQHLVCIGIGSLSIWAGLVFKLIIPSSIFDQFVKNEEQE